MNRGSNIMRYGSLRGSVASMRPRFMNRGSSVRGFSHQKNFLASMRPRFMNRGSNMDMHKTPQQAFRFNEAPIHESGKYPFLIS